MSLKAIIYLLPLNIFVWLILHIAISWICLRMPLTYFQKDLSWFKIRNWEKEGLIWDRIFHVKRWKKHLIDGSSIAPKSFDKRHLHGTKLDELDVFSAETKRAEMTHWVLMGSALLFFVWNPWWANWIIVIYALLSNLPFILTQRYNRGRIERVMNKISLASR